MTPVLRRRRAGDPPGVVLFLNAGDPSGGDLEQLLLACDEHDVAAVELAVPFPDSPTDGPVVRRSAARALAGGATFASVLATVAAVRPRLARTRVVLLADWAHSVRPLGLPAALARVAEAGSDAVLLHGLPPRLRDEYRATAAAAGLPVVTTCYHGRSSPQTLQDAAEHATAYVYLVSRFGRTGGSRPLDVPGLTDDVAALRAHRDVPVAVGFGVRGAREVRQVGATGADAAVIGSAAVTAVEEGLATGDLHGTFRAYLAAVTDHRTPVGAAARSHRTTERTHDAHPHA